MIDIKILRENPDLVRENIKKKFQDHKLGLVDEVLELDVKNRQAIARGNDARKEKNEISQKIGVLMREGKKEEAGAMNRRAEISRNTLGIPVLSMGVPTVVDGVTVGAELLSVDGIEDSENARGLFSSSGQGMLVTPKEIDLMIDRASRVLAMALNRALQPQLSQQEIWELTS